MSEAMAGCPEPGTELGGLGSVEVHHWLRCALISPFLIYSRYEADF